MTGLLCSMDPMTLALRQRESQSIEIFGEAVVGADRDLAQLRHA